jgi:CubicO group peptidase (beta-lactamase class C family)
MSVTLLQDFIEEAARRGLVLHGAAVQQHGKLLDEHHWTPDLPHVMHSFSKSFLSSAVGMAVEEGRFGLHDRVVEFSPRSARPR